MASWTCSASSSSPRSNCVTLSTSDKDLIGGTVFAFVQTDLRNNIAVRPLPPISRPDPAPPPFFFCLFKRAAFQGVRTRYNAHKSESETLENLVQAEAREGGTHGTACLVRLTR
jgi:hypothetical protein